MLTVSHYRVLRTLAGRESERVTEEWRKVHKIKFEFFCIWDGWTMG